VPTPAGTPWKMLPENWNRLSEAPEDALLQTGPQRPCEMGIEKTAAVLELLLRPRMSFNAENAFDEQDAGCGEHSWAWFEAICN